MIEEDNTPPVTVLRLPSPQPPTPTQFAWNLAKGMAVLVALIAVVAVIGMFCWNNLTSLTNAPDVTFNQAFAVTLLIRMTGVILRA